MAVIEETVPQHMEALRKANRVRLERAELRREVAAGETSLAEALEHPAAQSATVYDVVRFQHRWGRRKALRLLASVPLSEGKLVGALTERQRGRLTGVVPLDVGVPVAPRPVYRVSWRTADGHSRRAHLTVDSNRALCGPVIGHDRVGSEGKLACASCERIRKLRGW